MSSRFRFITEPSSSRIINYEQSQIEQEEIQRKPQLKLPKLKGFKLTDEQIDEIDKRVLKIKRSAYGPYGCSRSPKLQSILIMKRFNPRSQTEHGQRKYQSRSLPIKFNEKKLQKMLRSKFVHALTPQNYISKVYI